MPTLSTTFCRIPLSSPLVAAPAGVTETAERLKRCEDVGCGAAVIKSYFQYELARHNPTPRFRVIRHGSGRDRSYALYSFEQANVCGLDEFGEQIRRAKEICDMPIFASINCTTPDRWVEAAAVCEQAGADAIELNASCPHGPHLMARLPMAQIMTEAMNAARQGAAHTPLIPKVPSQLDDPSFTVHELGRAGADAVVMFNRFTGLDVDLDTERPVMHGGYAGHGGPWAIHYVMRWISATFPGLPIPIAASGGVMSGLDAVKLLLCGAAVVQTCTAMVMEGYEVVTRMNEQIAQWMEQKGYETLDQFRGAVCGRILSSDDVDRVKRLVATIDAERCTSCGRCGRVCIYRAPIAAEGVYTIPEADCDGCGLCVELCPALAIGMRPLEEPRGFELGVK